MSTPGKLIINRVTNGRFVVSAATEHGNMIVERLIKVGDNVGVPLPDPVGTGTFVKWVGAVCDAKTSELDKAERLLVEEISDDDAVRVERDEATSKLAGALQHLKGTTERLPPEVQESLGLSEQVPDRPDRVLAYGQAAKSMLEKSDKTYSVALGTVFAPKAAAAALVPLIDNVIEKLGKVTHETRQYEVALGFRNQELQEWGDVYQGTAATLEGLIRLAGDPALADKVRPTIRRRQGEDVVETEPTAQAPQTPTEPTPSTVI